MTHHGRTTRNAILAVAAALMLTVFSMAQYSEKAIHTFTGGKDGAIGGIQLVSDSAGNLYGTTFDGGNRSTSCEPYTGVPGCGVVFKLTRDAHGDWKETVLHTFTGGKDGALPIAVILDSAGNLYGTTFFGGDEKLANCRLENVPGCGVVFKLTPRADGLPWKETVLHTFTGGTDGRLPWAGLTFDQAGNLYGTATRGGDTHCKGRTPFGCGVAFRLTPTTEGPWTESVIYTFETTGRGGYLPYGGLTFDSEGNLYGTAYLGGDNSVSCFGDPGCGVVYELTPRAHGPWKETVLHAFTGGTDGGIPLFYVTLDSRGNVYGTTIYGGDTKSNNCLGGYGFDAPAGCGVVFKLTRGAHGAWKETELYSFTGGRDGAFDTAPVVFGSSGNIYGMTGNGGYLAGPCTFGTENNAGCGVVFQLTPTTKGPWTESVLYAFTGGTDGSGPESNLLLDSAGNIFGVTEGGGNISECSGYGCGVVFKIARGHNDQF
jgi:hypothetical protein